MQYTLQFPISRLLASAVFVLALLGLGCHSSAPQATTETQKPAPKKHRKVDGLNIDLDADSKDDDDQAQSVTSEADLLTHHPDFKGTSHDLAPDEQSGGHTLRKHVGRSDNDLRGRLAHEDISAASTYTDRESAQFAVGNALQQNQDRIASWMVRSSHPNLVLDYEGDQPIGRTLHRGDTSSRPCANAKVVLRWLSSSEYYVLTSYPECR